jgi:glycogen debranching enzyme
MTDHDGRLLVRDGTFAVLDASGDVTGAGDGDGGDGLDGLFRHDARHLSRWRLTLDDAAPVVLLPGAAAGSPQLSAAVLTPAGGTRHAPARCSVFREQALEAHTLVERLRIAGNTGEAVTVTVGLTVDADFADQFALRTTGNLPRCTGRRTCEALPGGVEFHHRRGDDWHARTVVTAEPPPERVAPAAGVPGTAQQLTWTVRVPAHGSAEIALRVAARPPGTAGEPASSRGGPRQLADGQAAEAAAFVGARPRPQDGAGDADLARACEVGLADLAGLRVPATGPDGEQVHPPAAGVPWFLTLFGRDSLLTSLFALPWRAGPAAATLPALAALQATGHDAERIAEPGKIVHEVRHGELARFRQVPYGRYYGSVDATPLFLVLLGAYTEQQGDTTLARRLEPHARAAVEWMDTHGGLAEHGYLRYTADAGGLANQNWKDSPGAICSADGVQAAGALAVAEVQGYAYDALVRTAWLARTVWGDTAYAGRLAAEAAALRERFRRDFWMPAAAFPALALDGAGRQADALASDAGHLLWSGILDDADAAAVARRLLEPDFFSGWGVRTLAAGQGAYHPLSYHRGSVWPHDNAVIALGMARYGLREEARTVARGLSAAAGVLDHRLPEVFAGYGRDEHPHPVPYPHSCSPQAWAAATPLALRTAVTDRPGT